MKTTPRSNLEARHAQSLSPPYTCWIHIRYFSNPGGSDTQSDPIGEVCVRLEISFSILVPSAIQESQDKTKNSPWPHVVCKHCSI